MTLSELRDFAKRMGGDALVVVELRDVDGAPYRVTLDDMMAERSAKGQTLVLMAQQEGGSDA